MNPTRRVLALAAFAWCTLAAGQTDPNNNEWVGIWHARPDGLPTGTLTLATDSGTLGGTLVLDIVSRDGGQTHVIAAEPHVLVHPLVEGNTLSFEVRTLRKGVPVPMNFTLMRTAQGKAALHCTDCGPDAPTIEMTRDQWPGARGRSE